MEKDIDEIKPRKWLVVILILIALAIGIVLINKIVTDRKENKKESNSIFDKFNINKIESTFSKDSFNSKFEFYSGSKNGISLENMFEEVITNNKKNKDKQITIKYNEISTSNSEDIKKYKKRY